MLKKSYKIIFILILLLILVYVSNVFNIPNKMIIFKNEDLNIKTILGVNIEKNIKNEKEKIIQAINNENSKMEQVKYDVKLFNHTIKQIDVSVISKMEVVPLGKLVGIKLYSNGVLVVGMSDIDGKKPYEEAGILEGDRIVEINNQNIISTSDLINCISQSKGAKINLKYIRNNELYTTSINPIKTNLNEYKIGLWVKDTAGGVGTLSFYNPENNMVASLGHAIVDIDTGEKIDISKGKITTTNIINLVKGKENIPGKIQGTIEKQEDIGEIYANTDFGIFGKIDNINKLNIDISKKYEVALRNEIDIGEATLLCNVENDKIKEYKINIEKKYVNNNENNKSMLIKVSDQELLNKVGGIVQGMSGSPIIQNGKLVGVLTHVLVSDPTTGYAVFADTMIKQMKEIE